MQIQPLRWFDGAAAVVVAVALASCHGPTAAEMRQAPVLIGGPSFQGSVKLSLATQTALVDHKEHCSADADELKTIGRALRQQVRVYRDGSGYALYTVSETHDEMPETILRMGKTGRERLGTADEFPVVVLAQVPNPTLSDADAKTQGEFVERSLDDGVQTGLLVLAPHGGQIEIHTDEQAERVSASPLLAGKPVTTWRCKGYDPPGTKSAFARWHITSDDTSEASFPLLAKLATRRYAFCVSFHGMDNPGVLIGGAASMDTKTALQALIVKAINDPTVPVAIAVGDQGGLGGNGSTNIVNRYCNKTGIQIEQSLEVRRDHWQAIADAVARFYADQLQAVPR